MSILVAKAVAVVYGYLALAVAVLYSISRRDTWQLPTEDDEKRFEEGKD